MKCIPFLSLSNNTKSIEKTESLKRSAFIKLDSDTTLYNIHMSDDFIFRFLRKENCIRIRQLQRGIDYKIRIDSNNLTNYSFENNKYHILFYSRSSIYLFCRKSLQLLHIFQNNKIQKVISIDSKRLLFLSHENNLYIVHLKSDKMYKVESVTSFKWTKIFSIHDMIYLGNNRIFIGACHNFQVFDILKNKLIMEEDSIYFRCAEKLGKDKFLIGADQLILYRESKLFGYHKKSIFSTFQNSEMIDKLLQIETDTVLCLSSKHKNYKLRIYDINQNLLLYQYELKEFPFFPNIFLYTNYIVCQYIGKLLILRNPFHEKNKRNIEKIVSAVKNNPDFEIFNMTDIVYCISEFLFF